jgi:8-oxo-dGTP pyrophosphatase MutT (NUDIX family)
MKQRHRDGWYCLPSGHLENGETIVECVIREEVGVDLDPASPRPAAVVHHMSPEGHPRMGVFFATDHLTLTRRFLSGGR